MKWVKYIWYAVTLKNSLSSTTLPMLEHSAPFWKLKIPNLDIQYLSYQAKYFQKMKYFCMLWKTVLAQKKLNYKWVTVTSEALYLFKTICLTSRHV